MQLRECVLEHRPDSNLACLDELNEGNLALKQKQVPWARSVKSFLAHPDEGFS
jgi:hypothetical protein